MTVRMRIPVLVIFATLLALPAAAQPSADAEEAVRAAVLDYVEAIYNAQPERIERSVDPALAKTGFFRPRNAETYRRTTMSYDELIETAETYNAAGRDHDAVPRLIDVYSVLDKTASARLLATWGVDYFLLGNIDDQWKVTHVLWQSHTPETMKTLRDASEEVQEP